MTKNKSTSKATKLATEAKRTKKTMTKESSKPVEVLHKAKEQFVLSKTIGGNISQSPIEFTKDSKYFFSGVGSAIKIFSIATGAAVKVLSRSSGEGSHRDKVTAVFLNPKNPLQLFSASLDGTIKLWDYNDEVLLKTFHVGLPITHFLLSPTDPEQVYLLVAPYLQKKKKQTIDEDVDMTLDKKNNSKMVQVLQYSLTISPGEEDKEDGNRSRLVAELDDCHCIAISADGTYLALGTIFNLYIWTINQGENKVPSTQLQSYLVREGISQIAFNPTKLYLAVGQRTGRITFYHCFTPETVKNPTLTSHHWHYSPVQSLKFMHDGNYLLSGAGESVLVVWQLDTGFRRFFPRCGGDIRYINITPNHKYFSLSLGDNSIRLINGVTQAVEQVIQGVQQWDARQGQLELQEQQNDRTYNSTESTNLVWAEGMTVEPRNHHLVLNGSPGTLQFYDAKVDNQALDLEIIPNSGNARAVVGTVDATIDRGHVSHVSFSPNGEWMATVDMRNDQVTAVEVYLKFWLWDHDQQTYVLHTRVDRPHSNEITSLCFHPSTSSPMVVTTSMDKSFKIWHLTSYEPRESIVIDQSAWTCRSVGVYRDFWPTASTFSLDGSMLTVAFGPVVTVWDPYQNVLQGVLTTPEVDYIKSLHFVNDTPYLVSRSKTHLFVWNLLTCTVWWSYQMRTRYVSVDPRADRFVVVVKDDKNEMSQLVLFEPSSPQPLLVQLLNYVCQGVAWVPFSQQPNQHHQNRADVDGKQNGIRDPTPSTKLTGSDLAYLQPNHTIKILSIINASNKVGKKENNQIKEQEEGVTPLATIKDPSLLDDTYGSRQQQKKKDALQLQSRLHANVLMREDAIHGKNRTKSSNNASQVDGLLDAPSHVLPSVDTLFETFMTTLMDLRVSEKCDDDDSNRADAEVDVMDWSNSDRPLPSVTNDATTTSKDTIVSATSPLSLSTLDQLPLVDAYFASIASNQTSSIAFSTNDSSSSSSSDDDDNEDEEDVENIDW
ncbi:WD40-repeat-containing domain protein [Halteromyces radiatus]|uniref:WD40-repeat-containing domain protein n=1 Tax=Halteromyces radiatus TaxID=101107 RepID=UPI0022209145|nr:WD40-repeat-containing domain protein [Halteromyces radiatus]KAI8093755.1 WD40-repeat-containing domain protein [Halteromyces radiatus]